MTTEQREQTSTTARRTPPTERSSWDDDHSFRVWAEYRVYDEDPLPWKCLASFKFLQECLDYIAYCNGRGSCVVFQSPAEVKEYKPASEVL
jgi:hypothetical protein